MRSLEEIRKKIDYLEAQKKDLEEGGFKDGDYLYLVDSLDNDVVLLRWVCGDLEL